MSPAYAPGKPLKDFRKEVDTEGRARNRESMGDYDEADDAVGSGGSRPRRWTAVLAVVAALAVGVGLGYVWRSMTEPAPPPAAAPPAAAAPATPPPAPTTVPSPCIAVAQRGSDVLAQLDAAARAVAAVDPATLRQVLDEVRRLRDELQRDVDACRGQVSGGPPAVTPAPVTGG